LDVTKDESEAKLERKQRITKTHYSLQSDRSFEISMEFIIFHNNHRVSNSLQQGDTRIIISQKFLLGKTSLPRNEKDI